MFSGLNEGSHDYEFSLDENFFKAKENSLIMDAKIQVKVVLNKKSNQLELDIAGKGWFAADCDRCLEPIQMPIVAQDSLIVKFSAAPKPYDDGVVVLAVGTQHLEMYDLFYEMVCLNLPMIRNCELSLDKPACDENTQPEEKEVNDEIDPRWNKLKDLIKGR